MTSTYRLTRKRRGEIAEAAFLHKAAQLGFTVSKTWGDSDHYDFIIDSGARSWRIQVKSAHTPRSDGYRFRASGCARDQIYTPRDIDFLVAYIAPEDAWYVLPIQLFARIKSVKIITHSKKGVYRFGAYRDAWCQLTCPTHGEPWPEIRVLRLCNHADGSCNFGMVPQVPRSDSELTWGISGVALDLETGNSKPETDH